jgi:hypothetical protein
MIDEIILSGYSFARHVYGVVRHPYETYRDIVDRGKPLELVYIGFLLTVYFALATLVKTSAFRPFLLTKQFIVLSGWVGLTYIVTVGVLWFAGSLLGGKGTFAKVALAWGYTLLPTVCWFLATSVLYVLLPPPRTTRMSGIIFSLVYLVFSAMLLWWKVTLGYLVLRFGLKMDLTKIVVTVVLCLPILGAWSYVMYRMGICKVPFI